MMAGYLPSSQDDEDEAYWHQSTKLRPVFDDDDDDDSEFGSNINYDVVTWGGDEIISQSELSAQSARYRNPIKPTKDVTHHKEILAKQVENKAHAKKDQEALAASFVDAFCTPDDIVIQPIEKTSLGRKTIDAKVEAEGNYWKRRAKEAEASRWTSLPVEETITRILDGHVYTLEAYKSLEEKISLLEAAVASCDGNALTAAVVFLRKSVKTNIFLTELRSRPVAQDHYLQYLRQTSQISELIETLGMFGLTSEAATLKFSQANKTINPDQKIKSLKACCKHIINLTLP